MKSRVFFFLCFGSSGRRFLLFLFNFFEWENDVKLISSFMEVFEKTKVEKMYWPAAVQWWDLVGWFGERDEVFNWVDTRMYKQT